MTLRPGGDGFFPLMRWSCLPEYLRLVHAVHTWRTELKGPGG